MPPALRRGVDGRTFPWGDTFDATLCKIRESRQGRPQPEPPGAFQTDVSIYGVRDMAGGVRDWCGDDTFGGEAERRPVRGGSWFMNARYCRTAYRNGVPPQLAPDTVGCRLVRACEPR